VTKRLTGTLLIAVMCFFNHAIIAQDKIQPIKLVDVTGNAPEETKKQILKIEEEHSKAVFDQDTATLQRLLADGWAYTNERREVLSKQQWIANIKSRKFGMDTIVHDQIRIDQFGDTVVVMGRSISTLHYQDKTSTGPRRFELVFAKMGGQWKLVGHFVSLVPHD
jgi:hypothetical protein